MEQDKMDLMVELVREQFNGKFIARYSSSPSNLGNLPRIEEIFVFQNVYDKNDYSLFLVLASLVPIKNVILNYNIKFDIRGDDLKRFIHEGVIDYKGNWYQVLTGEFATNFIISEESRLSREKRELKIRLQGLNQVLTELQLGED